MVDDMGYGTPEAPTPTAPGGQKTFVERAWDAQHRLENRLRRFGAGRYARVIKMARKPEPEEYRRTALIVGVGLFIMGFIGFTIFLLMEGLSGLFNIK